MILELFPATFDNCSTFPNFPVELANDCLFWLLEEGDCATTYEGLLYNKLMAVGATIKTVANIVTITTLLFDLHH